MANNFTTQSTNFFDLTKSYVDPRTGQFLVNLQIARLSANNGLGPDLPLALNYSPLNNDNSGFGVGFGINNSFINSKTRTLQLSDGETYKLASDGVTVLNKKLDNFFLLPIAPETVRNGYKIIWKSGIVEYLTPTSDQRYFIPTRIQSPLGHSINLKWSDSSITPRLQSIRDAYRLLVSVHYTNLAATLTLWPDTEEESVFTFSLTNGDYLTSVSREIGDGDVWAWLFQYTLISAENAMRLVGVQYPTGLKEIATYGSTSGLKFPAAANRGWLPVVNKFVRAPGYRQPEIVSTFEYTLQNFLGFNGDFGTWSADSDYLYNTLTGYTYGSTETTGSGSQQVSVIRRYNNYHMQVSEETRSGTTSYRSETEYYARQGVFITQQPANFLLPKSVKETFTDTSLPFGQQSRQQITLTEFDHYGNPTRELTPDGTETETSWYAADGEPGCPADPYGFVRFLKSKTVIPPPSGFNSPEHRIEQRYIQLPGTDYVVLDEKDVLSDETLLSTTSYTYNTDDSDEYGRLTNVRDTLYDSDASADSYSSDTDIVTTVNNTYLEQVSTFTGYDGLVVTSIRESSVLSGLLYSETNAQEVETCYSYDSVGRILTRTHAHNTEYENTIAWDYEITDDGVCTTERLDTGIASCIWYDGAAREVRRGVIDPDWSSQWLIVNVSDYDELGRIRSDCSYDYLPGAGLDKPAIIVSKHITYDAWGNVCLTESSDGLQVHCIHNPIALTQLSYLKSKNASSTANRCLTQMDINGDPVSVSLLDDSGNIESTVAYLRDGLGRICQYEDAVGGVTVLTYDSFSREVQKILPDEVVISRQYAPFLQGDFPIEISVMGPDDSGRINTWEVGKQGFDSLGRLTVSSCGGRSTRYFYAGASRSPSNIVLPSGESLAYTQIPELADAVEALDADGLEQQFEYAPSTGLMISATDSTGVNLAWNHTPTGFIEQESVVGTDQVSRDADYTWSLLGRSVTQIDVAGHHQQYRYDQYGRLLALEDSALIATVQYDGFGRASYQSTTDKATGERLNIVLELDSQGREKQRTLTDSVGATVTQQLSRRADGLLDLRRTLIHGRVVREETFSYDARNRLVKWTADGSMLPQDSYGQTLCAQEFTWDALNNVTQVLSSLADTNYDLALFAYENPHDPMQLTRVTHTAAAYPPYISLEWDACGRMVKDEQGRTRQYDVSGRLIGLFEDGETQSLWRYDGLNRLAEQQTDETSGLFYQGNVLVSELAYQSGRFTRRITHSQTCFAVQSDQGLTLTGGDQNGSLLWSRMVGKTDGEMSAWSVSGEGRVAGLLPGFNGQRQDPVSGLYHLGNGYRDYIPELMCFTAPDNLSPFGGGGINPYAYCAGDPVNFTDPSGHMRWSSILGIVLGAIGLTVAVASAGLAIGVAGGIAAAYQSASAATLIIGGLGVVSDVTGIVSGAIEGSSPESSSVLGWVSLATGLAGLGLGIGAGVMSKAGASASKGVTVYRGMTKAEFEEMESVGRLVRKNKGEGYFTESKMYAARYAKDPEQVLVKFELAPYALDDLKRIAVKHPNVDHLNSKYPGMPNTNTYPKEIGGWRGEAVNIKYEQGVETFSPALGVSEKHGRYYSKGLYLFNRNITGFEVVNKPTDWMMRLWWGSSRGSKFALSKWPGMPAL